MFTRNLMTALAFGIFTLGLGATAHAGHHGEMSSSEKSTMDHGMMKQGMMEEVLGHYTAIADALAADSVDGVAEHAKALRKVMPAGAETADEGHASIAKALKTLTATDTDLEHARAAFSDLSAVFVPMAQHHVAMAGASDQYEIVYCSMAPGDWIQKKGDNENPYYGSKMLRCGNKLGALGAEKTGEKLDEIRGASHDEGHGDHGHDRS